MALETSTDYFGKPHAVTAGELMLSQDVECPLCHALPYHFATDYQGFRLCRCGNCSLEFVSPRMSFDDLSAKVYSDNYFPPRNGKAPLEADLVHYFSRQLADFESLLGGTGKMLDIGCGNGAFLDFAREAGWEIAGVDINLSPGARLLDCPLWEGSLETINFEGKTFSLIRLNHVLEHTQNPLETLKICRSLLAPGGIIYVSVPNIRGVSPRLKNLQSRLRLKSHRWRHYAAMHHLFFFSPATLQAMIERAGLHVVSWCTPVAKKGGQNRVLETIYRLMLQGTATASILDFYCSATAESETSSRGAAKNR